MTITQGQDGVGCPPGVPVRRWAREQALAACVPGVPGWFAVAAGDVGAVNVRAVPAVFCVQSQDDGCYRVVATVERGGWELQGGPYVDEYEAGRVCQAVLVLAYDTAGWPPAEPVDTWDTVDGTAAGEPILYG